MVLKMDFLSTPRVFGCGRISNTERNDRALLIVKFMRQVCTKIFVAWFCFGDESDGEKVQEYAEVLA